MKVVAIGDGIFEDRRGGARRYLSELRARLSRGGHQVDLVVPRFDPSLPAEGRLDGSRVFRHEPGAGGLPLALIARYRSAQQAFQMAISSGCDLVNVHFAQTAFAALRSARGSSLPVLYTFHGPWPGEVWVERHSRVGMMAGEKGGRRDLAAPAVFAVMFLIERAMVLRADRLLVLSDFSRRTLSRWYGVRAGRVAVVPGGVDTDRFRPHPHRDRLREELGLCRDELMLFTARRVVSRMGLELLLAAVRQVAAHRPLRLYIAGTGPLRASLEQESTRLGVDGLVHWLGGVSEEDLVRFYQAADLVVMPTVAYEGFGLVTVEALACGTPVVATPVGASPEILMDLRPELVSAAATADALAEAIAGAPWLAVDREECRRYAEARYSWEAVFPRVEREFIETCRRRGGA